MKINTLWVRTGSHKFADYAVKSKIKLRKLLKMQKVDIDLCVAFVGRGYLQHAKVVGRDGIRCRITCI